MPNDADLAREQLRPYVEIPAFREYLKEHILKWETWHHSQVAEMRMHESCRDQGKEQLQNGIRTGTVDPNDPDDIYLLSYEWHKFEVSSIPKDLEFRLIAEREPISFQEASVAAMVAPFWCDINRSNLLVPEYDKQPDFDFLDPYGTFQTYLFEQWNNPIQDRYKYIDWFVEAAINAYIGRIEGNSVSQSTAVLTEQKDNSKGSPPGMQKQSAEEREAAFDEAILGYADSDWMRDKTLNNKAWRVRSKEQTGELFGEGLAERGWYQSKTEQQVIKKDKEGAWVYLTASHSKKLKEFFSAFVA